MGITLPAELADVADQVGVQWPQADETKMHAAAQAWRTAAQKLTTLAKDADTTATQALGAMSGGAADKASAFWEKFVHGENGHFTQAVQGCIAAADRLEQAADKIGAAKAEIVRKLTALAQHGNAANATQSDVAQSQLGMLTSGASNDISGILSDLTNAVNPRALQVPQVSADGQTVLNPDGTVSATTPQGGLLGLSTGLPDVKLLDGTPSTDPQSATTQNGLPTGQIDPLTGLPLTTNPNQQPPLLPGMGLPGADNSAEVTGPVPQHVIDAAQPQPQAQHYYQPPVDNGGGGGGGYGAPQPSYSDPSPPTGPVHIPPAHVAQSTTVESAAPPPVVSAPPPAAAPAYNPQPTYQPPSYQQPAGGGFWTSGDTPPPVAASGAAAPRFGVPAMGAQPGVGVGVGGVGQPVPGSGTTVGGSPVGGSSVGGSGVGGSAVGGAQVGAGQGVASGVGQSVGGVQPGATSGVAATRQPGAAGVGASGATDVPATYVDPRAAAPAKPIVRRPADSPGLFLVYMFPIGHMPVPSARPARQLPPPPAEVDYAAGLRFVPHDHPESDLMEAVGPGRVEVPEPRSGEESGLAEDYDPLGGEHERDWDRRFLVRAGDEDRRSEYAWPPGELFPEGGCDAGDAVVLEPDEVLDRFGPPEGRVFSAEGTPFAQRSLPPEHLDAGYQRYRVLKPLPVWRTISAAWFGQPGGGLRYRAVYPAADLVALGFLEAVS